MAGFIGRKIVHLAIVLALVYTGAFVLLHALPGDAIAIRFQDPDLGLSAEEVSRIREAYGAEVPLFEQFLASIGNLFSGHLGTSISRGADVGTLIAAALPVTLRLALLSALVGTVIALVLVAAATLAPVRAIRHVAQLIPVVLAATPSFWFAIVLIQVISFQLGWIPVINPNDAQSLVLPVLTLGTFFAGPVARVLTDAVHTHRWSTYAEAVRSRGASELWILSRENLRNVALPVVTIAALSFAGLLNGAVVTETIFALNGLGRLAQDAVTTRDFPLLQMILVVSATGYCVINVVADVVYRVLDPRVREVPA